MGLRCSADGVVKDGSRALTKARLDRQLEAGIMPIVMTDKPEIVKQSDKVEHEGMRPSHNHARGLLLVGIFKLSKAIFFTAVGAGAMHLVHKDVGDVMQHIVEALRLDPEHRVVIYLLHKADLINPHQLREAGTLSFLYAAVCVVEGTGLVLRKRWAEYFTVFLTGMGLPWECYELIHKFSPYKVGLLLINLVVLGYLIWVLRQKRAAMCQAG